MDVAPVTEAITIADIFNAVPSEDALEAMLDEESDADFGLPNADTTPRAVLKEWTAQDFSNIYTRFRPHLERHARRFLSNQSQVDEVVQDAFLYLMVTLPELDSEIGVLRFMKWKVRLLCLDVIRASGRAYINNIDDIAEPESSEPEVGSELEHIEDAAIVRLALAKLNPRHREVLLASMYEEKSAAQIAEQVGLSENATRQLIFRARAAFKTAWLGSDVDTTGMSVSAILSVAARKAAAEAKKAPVTAAASAPAASAAATPAVVSSPLAHLRGTTQKASRIRQLTARKTRESLQASAQLTQTHEVDMTKIVGLRARAKKEFVEREGVNLTYLPFIARAAIDALKAHPNINASYNEETGEITYYDAEHLGFAVDTEQGLLSPVIHNAGDLSLAGLARAINDIAARARSGGLKPDELSGGTFTITNIGSQGALFDTPILVPPQAAMLGTGAIVKRPRVIIDESGNESIGVRSVCYLPMTYDHRLIDGADAGRFLTTVRRRLEEGAFEAELGL